MLPAQSLPRHNPPSWAGPVICFAQEDGVKATLCASEPRSQGAWHTLLFVGPWLCCESRAAGRWGPVHCPLTFHHQPSTDWWSSPAKISRVRVSGWWWLKRLQIKRKWKLSILIQSRQATTGGNPAQGCDVWPGHWNYRLEGDKKLLKSGKRGRVQQLSLQHTMRIHKQVNLNRFGWRQQSGKRLPGN